MTNIILPFFIIIFCGIVFRIVKPGGLDAEKIRLVINTMVFNLFLPALCIKVFMTTTFGTEIISVPISAWGTLFIMIFANYLLFSKLFKTSTLERKSIGSLIIAATMGNVTYLGLPFLTGIYGQTAAKYALYYDLLATTPFLWLVGIRFSSHFGSGENVSLSESFKKLVFLPPLWGIALGILINLSRVNLPVYITKSLEMMSACVIPLMTFSVGLSLSFANMQNFGLVLPVVFMKLLVSPFISLFIGKLLGLTGTPLYSVFFEGGMPTMVLSLLIAVMFGLDVALSAFCIVVTTLASFVTLPLLVYLTKFFL